jgi:HemY protein
MHQAYQRVGDWEGIRKLIPSLNTNKVLMEAEIKLLETEAFSNLLRQASAQTDSAACEALWLDMPDYIKNVPGVSAIYFAAMIGAGAGAKIENELARAISKNWNETLLELFGSVDSDDIFKQIEMAQQWLSIQPASAVLLTVLGKLSLKSGNNDNAEGYLLRSIAVEPSVQAYQLLGDLSYLQGDKDKASEFYKQGLELASSEIVKRIDTIS